MKLRVPLILLQLSFASHAVALDDPAEMLPDKAQENRAQVIGAELRCLVCQNESIEDSSAPLARDLRRVVRQQVARGRSNQEVIAWMTARYGEFIRLKPRLSWGTALLWGMPFLALTCGLFLAVNATRRKDDSVPLSDSERIALDKILQASSKGGTAHLGDGE